MFHSRRSFSYYLLKSLISLFCLVFFCEYAIYYVVLIQCNWPILQSHKADLKISSPSEEETPVKVMFLSDPHLLGSRKGHWFDKLKREWQMYRAFQTSINLHNPEVVFILGDLFDEGQFCSTEEFKATVIRFNSMFSVPKETHLYVVAGNHDIGFHYVISSFSNQRFINAMNASNVKRVSIRGNHFVLLNSMALEGDGCFLCRSTEVAVNKISKSLKCAKGIMNNCDKTSIIKRYSRPILVQHYPLYRESDEICNELDEAPENIKSIKFQERWDCLSREASDQLMDLLNPRLVVGGHTHHGCRKIHRQDIFEMTIASFSWRNKNNPSFLLGIFTPNNYALSKCYTPVESTVHIFYVIGSFTIIIYLIIKFRRNRPLYRKLL